MARYLVEVSHEAEPLACIRAVKLLLETGSHYLTNSDFGCLDDDHRSWVTVEADSKEQAIMLVPPTYRSRARVVGLTKFTIAEMDELLKHHER